MLGEMAKVILVLAILLSISLSAEGILQGIQLRGRDLDDIYRVLYSANHNLNHHPGLEREATNYPTCDQLSTKLSMKNGSGTIGNYIVMTSSKDKSESYETIANMWKQNVNFLQEIRGSTIFGCAAKENCGSAKDILSCAFDNPRLSTLHPTHPPATTTAIHFPPVPILGSMPHALTKEMFQEILDQLKAFLPRIRYDDEYFMDLGSAAYWKCPFPNQGSDTHYIVGNGRVEVEKNDDFGVIMELGRGVPYHDDKMREAMINFARKWRNVQFNRGDPLKFGCSVDPDCHGNMILLCAFYPIDSSLWIQNRNLFPYPRPHQTPIPITVQALKYTHNMNIEARKHFNLILSNQLEDECLLVTKCEGLIPHQGFNKTYSERLGKNIEIFTGATAPHEINADILNILNGMKQHKFPFPYQFGCCYIPRCQHLVVSRCLFAS